MDFDDISLATFDELQREWFKQCSRSGSGICALADRYRQRDDCFLRSMHRGSFNFSIRLHWEDEEDDWLIRFPIPGKSMFSDDKVYREAVLMNYIAKETNIPIPKVICYGKAADNPTGLGPFIIMTWVEGKKMSDVLREQNNMDDSAVDMLNPNIDLNVLKRLYGQMAEVLISLWSLDFDKIGSLVEDSATGKPAINGRPLTQEENELIRVGGLKVEDLPPQQTYHSSTAYVKSLLDLQWTQLTKQRNSVYDSEDCRSKYACRQLMKAIALNFVSGHDDGPFKLFCDDLSPGNVLVDDSLEIVAVIDWEFAYAAPAQFAASIPWWLLLRRPDYLIDDIGPDSFFDAFLPKANLFLQALTECEQARGLSETDDQLSVLMQRSIEDRSAWFMLACRKVASVDLIYWDMLDEYCWGPRVSMADRGHTLTGLGEMHRGREDFVRLKIRQRREYDRDLGKETDVIYEPPTALAASQTTPQPHIQPLNSSSRLFLKGLATGLAFGLSVTLILHRFRRWA
ncbi:phosphotransferase family protein [Aspergillus homomorphus CBS 101889]|uniref:Aminoglycoside phosphotransferase domain-containing protein n=1 Tax=Aspergillus homomorphus (strain CBS 101889) TaxID=1450537 RepID=A0A395HWC4_ASPHC|nr:hypothetical protein BO97DRAFT_478441 [Aspergillus homomorphus CBS 101889]RAL11725.1 hypothetical protein BO97DRAFT_478441 [Aspergillus homomorphus CBS 101889]